MENVLLVLLVLAPPVVLPLPRERDHDSVSVLWLSFVFLKASVKCDFWTFVVD